MTFSWTRPTAAAYIDLENIIGRWWELPPAAVARHVQTLFAMLPRDAFAHVAGAPALLAASLSALPSNKHLMTSVRRPDAADEQLLRCLRLHPQDVREVWIVSGDHAFTGRALTLAGAGHPVHVVSRPLGLSPGLAAAAGKTHLLQPPTAPEAWTARAA